MAKYIKDWSRSSCLEYFFDTKYQKSPAENISPVVVLEKVPQIQKEVSMVKITSQSASGTFMTPQTGSGTPNEPKNLQLTPTALLKKNPTPITRLWWSKFLYRSK